MARPHTKVRSNRDTKIVVASFAAMCFGYYLLNHVSTWEEEDRKLGAAFYIVIGCILIFASFIILAALVRKKYFPKKRRRGSRPVFLDDTVMKRNKHT